MVYYSSIVLSIMETPKITVTVKVEVTLLPDEVAPFMAHLANFKVATKIDTADQKEEKEVRVKEKKPKPVDQERVKKEARERKNAARRIADAGRRKAMKERKDVEKKDAERKRVERRNAEMERKRVEKKKTAAYSDDSSDTDISSASDSDYMSRAKYTPLDFYKMPTSEIAILAAKISKKRGEEIKRATKKPTRYENIAYITDSIKSDRKQAWEQEVNRAPYGFSSDSDSDSE